MKTEHLGRWEKKVADVFREQNVIRFPQQLRVFNALVGAVRRRRGSLVYYVDEKPLGTPKQTRLVPAKRETDAMSETLNRLARHADDPGQNLMFMLDQINEKARVDRLPRMYGHIYARSSKHPETIQDRVRPLFPVPGGQFVAESIDSDVARKMRGIAESSHYRERWRLARHGLPRHAASVARRALDTMRPDRRPRGYP